MEVDGEEKEKKDGEGEEVEKGKVSTSGPRLSRRESYRTDKGFQIRLTRKTEFRARGEGESRSTWLLLFRRDFSCMHY